MIEFRDATKRYGRKAGGTEAVAAVSLTLSPGAVWAVVGPNGAGKSTLLSLLLGFIRPTEGDVLVYGEAPRDYLRDHGAGYLPERFSMPLGWRTGEALRMFGRMDNASASDTAQAIELMDLGPHVEKRTGELSRGLLQRVGLAQALIARRQLIVLDEPTEGLDPVWRVRLRDIVEDLRSEDRIVVIASHDLSELERLADRAIVLDRGSIRDILDVRGGAVSAEYRIRLAEPFDGIAEAFPGATSLDASDYLVTVGGAAELSQRLGGLIALGAIVTGVEPVRADLEERVRTSLADGGDS
ncbi:MAG TPA: ABC transporter ATP-binding protein [Longimicrobiales bacterium]|nr:ABC transporter ATP-binding protein [Longimicrobiales bacterium]